MSQIGGRRARRHYNKGRWLKEEICLQEFLMSLLVPQDFFRTEYDNEGRILTGRTKVVDKTLLNVGKKACGKSEATNSYIQTIVDHYGVENVGINVGYNLFDILGQWNAQALDFIGGRLGPERVQVVVIDDALTYLGKDVGKATLSEVTKVFQNARHLVNHRDEHDNITGVIIFILNIQDYYLLSSTMRRDWDFVIQRTAPKNKYHRELLKRELPPEGYKILTDTTEKLRRNEPDQSYKGNSVLDFGGDKYGKLRLDRVGTNYTEKHGPWWVAGPILVSQPGTREVDAIPSIDSNLNETVGRRFRFTLQTDEVFPVSSLENAFAHGRDNPFPIGANSRYNPDRHWSATYQYLCRGAATGFIAESLGVSDQMITNGYSQGGYVAIVIQEQIGYWIEPELENLIPDIPWNMLTGTGMSDLLDDEAMAANGAPGIGRHGEIKARRRRETPADSWVSNQMATHLEAGGEGHLYQVVLRRNSQGEVDHKLLTYHVVATNQVNESIGGETITEIIRAVPEIVEGHSPIFSKPKPKKRKFIL